MTRTGGRRGRTHRIVIAGAGHAAMLALTRLGTPPPGAEITLVSRGDAAHYSGMVPGWIEGIYPLDAMKVPLASFAARHGVDLVSGDIAGAVENHLVLADGTRLAFDTLVVNTGSETARTGPLAAPAIIPAKPFDSLVAGLAPHLGPASDVEAFGGAAYDAPACGGAISGAPAASGVSGSASASVDAGAGVPTCGAAASFAVIGAGPAGTEIALALAARRPEAAVTLVDRAEAPLAAFPPAARRRALRALARRSVTLRLGTVDVPAADVTLAVTGPAPPAWLAATPFARTADGYLATDTVMRSTSHPHVLAVGDSATREGDPRPKAGVFSVRAGPPLAEAIRRRAAGLPLAPVTLQRNALVLLSTGGRSAIGTRNGLTVEGRLVWRLKDHLDQAFMAQLKGSALM
ncbi:FAD-dependent oxidoreductase [Acuticoccus yangtzensis]|uniref:FAD-dependent oxidoreductase n=1 Tax=Acuticoccus yangtzensis TaxID=1443441 RepID=UPI0013009D23|nr:FAD-dependent oxidoreductase [Acuticoccus yangtzensis]